MARKIPEVVDVRELSDGPMAFLWRARLYLVHKIESRTQAPHTVTYDVWASTGRPGHLARYELTYTPANDKASWTLIQKG